MCCYYINKNIYLFSLTLLLKICVNESNIIHLEKYKNHLFASPYDNYELITIKFQEDMARETAE